MIEEDIAINEPGEDLLGRKRFSKRLAERIISYNSKNNIVIGISGSWGSGKTSIVNMTKYFIKKENINSNKLIIMEFNPWNFSQQNQLIFQFFNELIITLENNNVKGAIINKFKSYASKLTISTAVLIGGFFRPNTTKVYIDHFKHDKSENETLEDLKKELNSLLIDLDRKIIIVIDDIDRLNKNEIQQLFQLIKLLADFPNTIYLLTFDKRVVVNSLKEAYGDYNSEYLEKMVQVIFEVPLVTEREIEILFYQRITKVFESIQIERWDHTYFYDLYDVFLKYFFNNIRDLKRFFNTFHFIFDDVKEDVCPVDSLAMTIIQVFLPELYNYIMKNRYLFAFVKFTNYDTINEDKEKLKEELNLNIKEFKLDIPQYEIKILSFLKKIFPRLKTIYGDVNSYDNTSYGPWTLNKRICMEDNFDTYFKFTVPSWALSREEFEYLIKIDVTQKAINSILKLNEEKQDKYLKELDLIIRFETIELNKGVMKTIIEALISIGDQIISSEYDSDMDTDYIIYSICSNLFNRIDNGFEILKNAILTSDNIYTICYISDHIIEINTNDSSAVWGIDEIILTDVEIQELKDIVDTKIEDKLNNNNFGDIFNLFYILFTWRRIVGEDKVKKFMGNVNDGNLLDFSLNILHFDKIDKKIRWKYDCKSVDAVIDLQLLFNRISALDTINISKKEKYALDQVAKAIDKFLTKKS